jgi:saccharopine dehydrogenase (NAD+, L-lysine forming)
MNKIKVGVLRETKTPPDKRVVLPPEQAAMVTMKFPNIDLLVQPSDYRSFKDEEYLKAGITLQEDLSDCTFLLGVKEVDIPELIDDKRYLFFSHTAKKQAYNRPLLQACLKQNISLMDHEYLTASSGMRLVAFGRWAGIVGAYNGLIAFGKRNDLFDLPRAKDLHDMKEMLHEVSKIELPPIKILITGGGRVAHGALEALAPLNIKKVSPQEFLSEEFEEPVVCQIDPDWYVKRKDGAEFDMNHFFKNPEAYESTFKPFTKVTDFYIPCHFWDQKSPRFMSPEDMRDPDFRIEVIADVSCDIADPIPSTLRASSIEDPFYGYNPATGKESDAWDLNSVTVMAVDNLPGELPRDASVDFGNALIEKVFPAMFVEDHDGIVDRATITQGGKLTEDYRYLQDFVEGRE